MYKYLFIFICFTGYSQQNHVVSGTLIDSLLGNPLPFASIQFESNNQAHAKSQIADEKGFFDFKDLKTGKYTLTIQYVGYQT
ncbi:MAG: hypothetical protein RI903_1505, partial [Bacteroidota bacterium]